MRISKPNRATHTYRQKLCATPARVFPLLCPVREREWADGWLPDLVITSSGVAERDPAWSPDGKWIAYFSDESGEYALHLRQQTGMGEVRKISLGNPPSFFYGPTWSPDSKKIVFIDQAMKVHLHDLDKKETRVIAQELWLYHDGLSRRKFSWSRDSRWIAFAHDQQNQHTAIALYDTKGSKLHMATSAYYDDEEPTFDPDGKYLYYRSGREFAPLYSDLDNTWIYPNSQQLVAVALRKDVASPLAPRNDDEGEKKAKAADKDLDFSARIREPNKGMIGGAWLK